MTGKTRGSGAQMVPQTEKGDKSKADETDCEEEERPEILRADGKNDAQEGVNGEEQFKEDNPVKLQGIRPFTIRVSEHAPFRSTDERMFAAEYGLQDRPAVGWR